MKNNRNRKAKANYLRRQSKRVRLAWKKAVTFTNQGELNINWLTASNY